MKQIVIATFVLLANYAQGQNVDYSKYETLLKTFVSAKGRVNYKGIKANMTPLNEAIKVFETVKPAANWNQNQKLAYWMNAYNVYTIALVVENYPTKSIKGLYKGKPWDRAFIPNGKNKVSLNFIENDVLRKMGDPRIHFGINCASFSCPDILNKAFTPENVNATLDELAKGFVNNKTKNKITASKIEVSEIFNWFAGDFTAKNKSVIAFLNKYSNSKINDDAAVSFVTYNWDLNE
jgi:hypothetical protein